MFSGNNLIVFLILLCGFVSEIEHHEVLQTAEKGNLRILNSAERRRPKCGLDSNGKYVCNICDEGYGFYNGTSIKECRPCNCREGIYSYCKFEGYFRKKICFCRNEYGNRSGKCVSCDCGKDSNCTFDNLKKTCLCPKGYTEKEGKCTNSPEDCETKPCKNGGTCIRTSSGAKCQCPDLYGGDTCSESAWCVEGEGSLLCSKENCRFNFTTQVGRCDCPTGSYYDYENYLCKKFDVCPFMPQKCKENEICRNSECYCKENFVRDQRKICVANFCAVKQCGVNEICEEIELSPENVKCSCKPGFVYNGKSCIEVNKCDQPGALKCEQICNRLTLKCECHPGFQLNADQKTCSLLNISHKCNDNCGVGICVQSEEKPSCVCPKTHVVKEMCLDLCTANQIPPGMCPDNKCVPDEKLGFKCKCEGKYFYDSSGVTCRRKLMCSEGKGIKDCAKRSAFCLESFNTSKGYTCQCKDGYEMDENQMCKKKFRNPSTEPVEM